MDRSLLNNHWRFAELPPPEHVEALHNLDSFLVQILYHRGITSPAAIQAFLDRRAPSSTDPFQLTDMQAAVERIQRGIRSGEAIAIYGDYDADGVTGTVLLTQALRAMGATVHPYIPHRIDEGYGLNTEALDALQEKGNSLVITVDCGIRGHEQIRHARDNGLDVIVTDHHSAGLDLPPAIAVIDHKRPGDAYPERVLAGVGLAYKLVQALILAGETLTGIQLDDLLDLVALGTVADLAPLVGENRELVSRGLDVIRSARRPGIAALLNRTGLNPQQVNATTIGFVLGPRINAAGRMEHAYTAARLLNTGSTTRAASLAHELDQLNQSRQELTRQMTALAEELAIQQDDESPLLFAAHPDFPSGIVGLIASRLQESHYRPAVAAQIRDGVAVGSCRSIPEFHITEALDECADLLVKHGGHAAAAGFTVTLDNLPVLRQRLARLAREQLAVTELAPSLQIDATLHVRDIVWEVQESLARLEPCGYSNPTPLLYSPTVRIENLYPVGADGAHLKLFFSQGGRPPIDGIAFRMGHLQSKLPQWVDVVYRLEVNEWNGHKSLQLNVQDMRPARESMLEY